MSFAERGRVSVAIDLLDGTAIITTSPGSRPPPGMAPPASPACHCVRSSRAERDVIFVAGDFHHVDVGAELSGLVIRGAYRLFRASPASGAVANDTHWYRSTSSGSGRRSIICRGE
jgi:hypothetical protein